MSDDRRSEPRTETAFLAVEVRGSDLRYRMIKNLSENGFFVAERTPTERPGDCMTLELPLPGHREPIRARCEVVRAVAEHGLGVRIIHIDRARYAHLLAVPPPRNNS